MNLGTENRQKTYWAIGLGVLAIAAMVYEFVPVSSSPSPVQASNPLASPSATVRPTPRRTGSGSAKKIHPAENLDPTLRLDLLASSEQIKYTGSGRNIFVSQAEDIPKPKASAVTDNKPAAYVPPPIQGPPPINLKFFGFANRPGEPKKIFLSQGEDVFIAGEGDIVDRRYKVVRISATSVEIQDVLSSGPPQNLPLTQG